MLRQKTIQTMNPTSFLPKRGEAREEHYSPTGKEPFGLNKRARRLDKNIPVTKPNGEWISQ